MYFETDAIVLKTTKTMNNDLFLTLFSRKGGKIEVVANGAKSSKSPLAACSKPFVFGNFMINTHGKTMKLMSCDIYDSHFRITEQLETLANGNYLLELCNLSTAPSVIDYEHYQLIVEAIGILARRNPERSLDYPLLRLTYLIKLAHLTGHQPELEQMCSACHVSTDVKFFSIEHGGLLCEKCAPRNAIKINQTLIQLIRYLQLKDLRIIIKTKIHEGYILHLMRIFEPYVLHHLGIKEIKSKDFLESIS